MKLARLSRFLFLCVLFSTPLFAQGYIAYRDLPYDSIPGVDPRFLALDLYLPDGAVRHLIHARIAPPAPDAPGTRTPVVTVSGISRPRRGVS